jgi:plasmid maintenance system antidote protein VapI
MSVPILQVLLRGAGLTQVDAAQQLGITEKHMSAVATGASGMSEQMAEKLSRLLGVSPAILYLAHYLDRQDRRDGSPP